MKAFLLLHFCGDDCYPLAVVLASSREEALQILGSKAAGYDNRFNDITIPTKGVDDKVQQECERAIRLRDSVVLSETPVVTA